MMNQNIDEAVVFYWGVDLTVKCRKKRCFINLQKSKNHTLYGKDQADSLTLGYQK